MVQRPFVSATATALAVAFLTGCAPASAPESTLITDVRVVDGTGAPAFQGGVRMEGARIVDVGDLVPLRGETVVDGGGLVLAPGFIDTHSHHDRGLLDMPDALGLVSQGVTTIVVGQDGGSHLPLADFLAQVEATPPAINVASYTGHGTLRRQVMGDDYRRPAGDAEVEAMGALLQADMDAGSLGLSTGLEYASGMDATTEEVIALAKVAGAEPAAGTSATCGARTVASSRPWTRSSASAGRPICPFRFPT